MSDEPALTVQITNATKAFGSSIAVNDLSLKMEPGRVYGLVGPNGSGKTTTIRMIVGIAPPTIGKVQLFGDQQPGAVLDYIGYVPEANGLMQRLKVIDQIEFIARLHGIGVKEARKRGLELLDRFGLGDVAQEKCNTMSKGMGQKIQIICSMLHDPQLLILDEPFSGLDPVNMEEVKKVILDYREANRTILFSTHIMEHAEQLCDSIILISNGRVLLEGTIDEIRAEGGFRLTVDCDGAEEVLLKDELVKSTRQTAEGIAIEVADSSEAIALLGRLPPTANISSFDYGAASLHDVFVRAVESDMQESSLTDV